MSNLGDGLANEHLGKCVRTCFTDIQVAGSQSDMEKPEGKTCFIISCQNLWKWVAKVGRGSY